jgi:KUP system potassium uptake protein
MAQQQAGARGSKLEIVAARGGSGGSSSAGDAEAPPLDVLRQDSLYRDATRPAHGHHGQVLAHTKLL